MSNRLLLLMVVAVYALSAHPDAPLQARAPFTAGLPDFPPLKKAVSEPRTATLPASDDEAFHVVTGQDVNGATVWWLLHKKPDGATLTLLPMKEDADGTLTVTQKLELGGTSNATKSLELRVPPARDVLLYRWLAGDAATIGLGQPLAEFTVLARDGRTLRLAGLKGSIVVLNSWATWCVPCVEELPSLNRLAKRYAGRGVEFVAILEPKASQDLASFLRKHPFAYRQTIATDSSRLVFGDTYPRHVILGADGHVAYASAGGSARVDRELSVVLDRLLAR